MKAKWIFGVLLVAAAVILVWRWMPGVRTRTRTTYEKLAGWTEEARREDPVGFLAYAQQRLQSHMTALEAARMNIRDGQERIRDEIERNRELLRKSQELARSFRAAYRSAEDEGAYPVTTHGSTYSREELIEQVRLILLQRRNYAAAIDDLQAAEEAAGQADIRLLRQVSDTQAALAALPAKMEIARVNQVAGDVQELLGQIDALIDRNEQVLQKTPVRTVEEILPTDSADETTADVDVMSFLEDEA